MSFTLAVCAEMVYLDLPIRERVVRLHERGFAVEIWDWTTKNIDALTKTGATFSSMTGYITGTLADPDGAEQLLRTAEQSLRVAEQLDCPRLNVHGTGLDDQGLPVSASSVVTPTMWLAAAKTLARLAEAARDGVMRVPGAPIAASETSVRMVIQAELLPLFGR